MSITIQTERMTENEDPFEHMPNFATEVLIYIFSFLKPKELTRCREVCVRWKLIVDSLFRSEILWRRHCYNDFADICKNAYYKRKSDLSWCHLYRSLSLWPKLQYATETYDEFASASRITEEIREFQVLGRGEIGVRTKGGIVYYDMKTLKQSNRGIISGHYLRYIENDEILLIWGFTLDLYIVRKIIRSSRHETDQICPFVKNFLLKDNMLYYVTLYDEIYVIDLLNAEIRSSLLLQMSESIMCLGHKNGHLHVLTFQRDIFTIVGKEKVFQVTLNDVPNLLHVLFQYNFLENLDWRVFFQWMFLLRHEIPQGSIRDIIVVKVYGDIVFVGSNSGILRIYYSPYLNNEFDLFNTEPVKQYNFMEPRHCPVLTMTPILHIDVIEGEDSHTVLVAMPKKIALLNFCHHKIASKITFDEAQSVELLDSDFDAHFCSSLNE